MTLYFYNKEAIDLETITVMGVSVKTGDSSIGYFGTGLKFAISTLLRNDHKVILIRDGEEIEFTSKSTSIRNEEFQRVYMGKEKLGFTTQLGRDWEVWQAFREIYSNCLDEDGKISTEPPTEDYGTIFKISGREIMDVYYNKSTIFIETSPIVEIENVEVHPCIDRPYGFYRGVRAIELSLPPKFTYNVLNGQTLTEDRTLSSEYQYMSAIRRAIIHSDDEDFIQECILAERGSYEGHIDFDAYITPSEAFMKIVGIHRQNMNVNQSAVTLWSKHSKNEALFVQIELLAHEIKEFEIAKVLLERIGCDVELDEILFVADLGPGIFGTVSNHKIVIDRKTFDKGYRFLASTIYEEWLHSTQQYKDESRELQNLLFERLFTFVDQVTKMEKNDG